MNSQQVTKKYKALKRIIFRTLAVIKKNKQENNERNWNLD